MCAALMMEVHDLTMRDGCRREPKAPRLALLVVVVAAVLAVVAGVSSVALAGGSLVDGRDDGPGFRAAPPTATKAAPTPPGQRANAANVPSRRSIIAARAAGSTKLASKLLRASA
jgi:hypothetical protein